MRNCPIIRIKKDQQRQLKILAKFYGGLKWPEIINHLVDEKFTNLVFEGKRSDSIPV